MLPVSAHWFLKPPTTLLRDECPIPTKRKRVCLDHTHIYIYIWVFLQIVVPQTGRCRLCFPENQRVPGLCLVPWLLQVARDGSFLVSVPPLTQPKAHEKGSCLVMSYTNSDPYLFNPPPGFMCFVRRRVAMHQKAQGSGLPPIPVLCQGVSAPFRPLCGLAPPKSGERTRGNHQLINLAENPLVQGCEILGVYPTTSVKQENPLFICGVSLWEVLLYHRSGHIHQPCL